MTRGEGPDKRLEFIYYPNLLGKPRTLDMVNRPFQTEVSGIAAVSELSRGFLWLKSDAANIYSISPRINRAKNKS